MSISLVMACFDDPVGVAWTLQTRPVGFSEVLVVDNNPDSPLGKKTAEICDKAGVKYIKFPTPKGTSAPRDFAIKSAESDWVVCTDSHCMIGTLPDVRELDTKNIYHPVQVGERGTAIGHSWKDVFRGGMQGVWTGEIQSGEIFASGLGCFLVHKAFWLGFHPLATEFGGEECYIHEKYRRSGGKAILLDNWEYWHCYTRINTPYPASGYARVRNYVLNFTELGWPLDRLHKYFVQGIPEDPTEKSGPHSWTIDQTKWDRIVNNLPNPPADCGCSGAGKASAKATNFISDKLKKYIEDSSVIFDPHGEVGLFAAAIALRDPETKVITGIQNVGQQHADMLKVRSGISIIRSDWRAVPAQNCDLLLLTPDSFTKIEEYSKLCTERIVCFVEKASILETFLRYNPEWTVIDNVAPLVVLSKLDKDKKKLPSAFTKAWKFGGHIASVVVNPTEVSVEKKFERRELCTLCPSRNMRDCGECGCPIEGKIVHEVSTCPLGKW